MDLNTNPQSFESDSRITEMVAQAGNVSELILNADFLLGEYMADYFTATGLLEMIRSIGLTPEQRIKAIMWNTALNACPDDTAQTFEFMQAVLQARGNLGRRNGQHLLDELGNAYMRIFRPEALWDDVIGDKPLEFLRYAVAGHLGYARAFLQEESVPQSDEDAGTP